MNYPLFLRFTGTTFGSGFAAKVEFNGKFLGIQDSEDGSWWLHGVNPSAIADCGKTLDEANTHLRESLRGVLAWLAGETDTFEAFEASVNRFVKTTNTDYLADWDAAVSRVRAHKECIEGLPVRAAFLNVDVRVSKKTIRVLNAADNSPSSELVTPIEQAA